MLYVNKPNNSNPHSPAGEVSSPVLVLIRGLPGSGKSHIAEGIRATMGERTVVVDPDKIPYDGEEYTEFSDSLSKEGVDAKLYPYRFLRSNAYGAIRHDKVVVWNQAFTNLYIFNRTILNLQEYAKDHGRSLPVVVVEVDIDHETAKNRVSDRVSKGGHDVPEDRFTKFIDEYKSFVDEGHEVVSVHGEDDVDLSVKTVVDAIDKARSA